MFEHSSRWDERHLRRHDAAILEIARAGLIAVGVIVAIAGAIWLRKNTIKKHQSDSQSIRRGTRRRRMLRRAIIGNSRQAILAVFGPPRSSAGFLSSGSSGDSGNTFLRACTWYYVLEDADRRAMVIEFENGVARNAQFIRGPQALEMLHFSRAQVHSH